MKHIKLFEDIKFGIKGRESYDEQVKKLYDDFASISKKGITDKQLSELFDEIQNEFDNCKSPEIYLIYKERTQRDIMGTTSEKSFKGIFSAYGEEHASVKYALKYKDPEIFSSNMIVEIVRDEDLELVQKYELGKLERARILWTEIN